MILVAVSAFASQTAGTHETGIHETRVETPVQLGLPELVGPQGEGVVGGTPVPEGKWDDAVGVVFYGAYVGCTGTLIGPKLVLTAGHCIDASVTQVLVGSKDWRAEGGELIDVERKVGYPNPLGTYDVGLLLLAKASSYEPRAIAYDCILKDHLQDGVKAKIVGFGGTRETGDDYFNSKLNMASTVVLDKNCDEPIINGVFAGCNGSVSPGGEIAAGGNGTDACFGDSGGPLYLLTPEGDYVVGVTSRAFLGVNPEVPCREGGIWARPDAVVDWIEDNAEGRKITFPTCNDAPEPSAADIVTDAGVPGTTVVAVNDPDGNDADAVITVTQEPEFGTVTVTGLVVQYQPEDDYVGADAFTVEVLDGGTGNKRTGDPVAVELDIGVIVKPSGILAGCGCNGAFGSGSLAGLGILGALAGLRRRR